MKKFLSVILSLVMAASVCTASAMVTMAASVASPASTTTQTKVSVQVNGSTSNDISYKTNPDNAKEITFTYDGSGELSGWEFPGMQEGVDYDIVDEDGNSITILVSEDYDGEVVANAVVKEDNGDSKTTTKKKSTSSTNGSSKSPATGVASTGIALAGAGVAILAALKKKDDAE